MNEHIPQLVGAPTNVPRGGVTPGLSVPNVGCLSPFFEVPGGTPAKKRLLLISPLFPPDQAVGALRWQKMAHYIAERGWDLDVIMLHPACIQSPDWTRLADLPRGTRLFGVRTPRILVARLMESLWGMLRERRGDESRGSEWAAERVRGTKTPAHGRTVRPTSLARSEIRWSPLEGRAYIRAYNSWFEYAQSRRWAMHASALARHVFASGSHDAIISSGPPHMAHEGARRVSRQTGLPFVMDMRDPWSLVQRVPEQIASPITLYVARWHERRAVEQASLVVTNTDAARSAMVHLYPNARGRILTVMNGFDEELLPRTQHGRQFIIAYAGTVYGDRDPSGLFSGARQVIDDLSLSPSQFVLDFIGGEYVSAPLTEMARAEGIEAFVRIGGVRPRAQALEFLAKATMLVILPQDSDMAIPAKVFEYVRFEAWLLALAERGSATELLLRNTTADVVSSGDISGIASIIRKRYTQYAAGTRPCRIAVDARLSRRSQAQLLLDAVEHCVRPTETGSQRYASAI